MTEAGAKSILKILCPACGRKLDVTELSPFSLHPCPHCQVPFKVPKWYQGILLEDILHVEPGIAVYRALDPTLDREACIKVLSVDGRFQPAQLDEFLAATRRMALINHAGVAAVYSCGAVENEVYAVTKYMKGVPWEELGDSPDVIRGLARQALAALEAADAAGIAHGGLRPCNLLCNDDGHLLVTDFGVSAALGKSLADDPYASPEAAAGAPPSRLGDVYSLGVCLYHQATGHFPGGGDLAAWRSGTAPLFPAKEYNPAPPGKLSDILAQMLALEPAERPRTYGDILAAFQAEIGSRKNVVLKLSDSRRPPPSGPRPGCSASRSGMILNILIAVGLLLLAGLGGLYALSVRQGRGILNAEGQVDWKGIGDNLQGLLPSRPAEAPSGPVEAPPGPAEGAAGSEPGLTPACLAARPRPVDLDFAREPEANRSYLLGVPEALRERERERLRILGGSVEYLLRMMRFVGYDRGDGATIEMRDGTRIQGAIPFASEKGFILRRRGDLRRGSDLVTLGDLSQNQVWDIFAFYAEKRAEMQSGRKLSSRDREEIFQEYLRLALLCDWYGDTAKSREFARAARQVSPGQAEQLAYFGLDGGGE
ncbi:MAG: hypothetical protein PHC30_02280 [Lentisphaeria bacterium]|nr:hypothetical protein [Lentisphaeria bacterium]